MPRDGLGDFEQRVLLTLLRLGDDAYTVPIVRELEARTGREAATAAVYIALRRLEERGLVRSELRDPGEEGGRDRRHFLLTDLGRDRLREAHRTYMTLAEGLGPLLEDV
jgi:PadR family transcriptional regulator, regulatory protein PadR